LYTDFTKILRVFDYFSLKKHCVWLDAVPFFPIFETLLFTLYNLKVLLTDGCIHSFNKVIGMLITLFKVYAVNRRKPFTKASMYAFSLEDARLYVW
jgi:hypothetical protein